MSPSGGEARKVVRVEIAGEEYKLRTEADRDYALRCAALVDERMREAGERSDAGARTTAIVAALSLAADLIGQRERVREDAARLTARLRGEMGGEEG